MKPLRKKLVEKLKNRLGEKELELLENAIDFAEKSHNGQKRKSGEPFIKHPLRVAYTLTKYKLDLNTIVSAVLHDTVEDCSVPLEEIKIKFGPEVAFLVQSLTKISSFKYKEPQKDIFLEKESFRNMILAMAKDLRVILIKLADRLDNAKTFWALEENKKNQKAKETLEIYAPLAYRLGMTDIGAKLEDLSFPYVFKEEYKETKKIVGNHREELENYLKELVPVLEKKLKENKLFLFKIKFRAKHLYSIWRKLQKEEMDIKRVYDLVALRIVLKKTEDCYLALGIIHGLWKPVPGRFKDYIALPKPNGYRSLHTSVFA
ncbi:MAG: HD domain-containing protein, partial [Candidatus Pacebacteria bacterium]|nr:HD domain-containing protein [Candidatus Paceibacterota bacterium]